MKFEKMNNIINETRQGLASLLYIQCECETTNKIFTSKHHFLKENDTNSHKNIRY